MMDFYIPKNFNINREDRCSEVEMFTEELMKLPIEASCFIESFSRIPLCSERVFFFKGHYYIYYRHFLNILQEKETPFFLGAIYTHSLMKYIRLIIKEAPCFYL